MSHCIRVTCLTTPHHSPMYLPLSLLYPEELHRRVNIKWPVLVVCGASVYSLCSLSEGLEAVGGGGGPLRCSSLMKSCIKLLGSIFSLLNKVVTIYHSSISAMCIALRCGLVLVLCHSTHSSNCHEYYNLITTGVSHEHPVMCRVSFVNAFWAAYM